MTENIHKVPCTRCGAIVKRHIAPSALKFYKAKCNNCAAHLRKHVTPQVDNCNSSIRWLARQMMINYGSEPPVIYRPGDPGFDEIAAQCDLQPRNTEKLPHYSPFESRNYHDIKR